MHKFISAYYQENRGAKRWNEKKNGSFAKRKKNEKNKQTKQYNGTWRKSFSTKPLEVRAGAPSRRPPGVRADLSPGHVFLLSEIDVRLHTCHHQKKMKVSRTLISSSEYRSIKGSPSTWEKEKGLFLYLATKKSISLTDLESTCDLLQKGRKEKHWWKQLDLNSVIKWIDWTGCHQVHGKIIKRKKQPSATPHYHAMSSTVSTSKVQKKKDSNAPGDDKRIKHR